MNYQWLFDKPIAHRGTHSELLPENSLPAYAESIKNGLNIEIDVHLSKDNHLIVHHDDSLKRMCGVDKLIKECTLEEIKECRIANTDYQVPTLEEFLDLVNGQTGILLEIKGLNQFDFSIVKAVIECLKSYNGPIALQSFNFGSVVYAKRHCKLPVGELCSWAAPDGHTKRWWLSDIMGKGWVCRMSKADFISYDVIACHPELKENKYIVKWGKKIPVIFWTIKTIEEMEIARKYANNVIFEFLDPQYAHEMHSKLMPFKCKTKKLPSNLFK